jgi:hypothetical protein
MMRTNKIHNSVQIFGSLFIGSPNLASVSYLSFVFGLCHVHVLAAFAPVHVPARLRSRGRLREVTITGALIQEGTLRESDGNISIGALRHLVISRYGEFHPSHTAQLELANMQLLEMLYIRKESGKLDVICPGTFLIAGRFKSASNP